MAQAQLCSVPQELKHVTESHTPPSKTRHNCRLTEHVTRVAEEGRFCDITLCCDGQAIMAHKIILSAYSTYFDSYLMGTDENCSMLSLDDLGITQSTLRVVMYFVYNKDITSLFYNRKELITIADKLGMNELLAYLREVGNDYEDNMPGSSSANGRTLQNPSFFASEEKTGKDSVEMNNSIFVETDTKPLIDLSLHKQESMDFDKKNNQEDSSRRKSRRKSFMPVQDDSETCDSQSIESNLVASPNILKDIKSNLKIRLGRCDKLMNGQESINFKRKLESPKKIKPRKFNKSQDSEEVACLEEISENSCLSISCDNTGDTEDNVETVPESRDIEESLQNVEVPGTLPDENLNKSSNIEEHIKMNDKDLDETKLNDSEVSDNNDYHSVDFSEVRDHPQILLEASDHDQDETEYSPNESVQINNHSLVVKIQKKKLGRPKGKSTSNPRPRKTSEKRSLREKNREPKPREMTLAARARTTDGCYKCVEEGCNYTTGHINSLYNHMKSKHSDERPYACQMCPKSFKLKKHLISHQHAHSEERKYACNHCEAKFKTPKHLRRHIKIHTGVKKMCSICDRGFAEQSALDRHIKSIHMGEKNFHCKYENCGYAGVDQNSLKSHIKNKHEAKVKEAKAANRILCDICGKDLMDGASLKSHMRLHGDVFHPCPMCDYTTRFKQALESHMFRRHSINRKGEVQTRPFQCQYCAFSTVSNSDLRRHELKHTSQPTFKCKECDYKAWDNATLKQHILWHYGDKPFTCNICNKAFSSRSSRARHMRLHLGIMLYTCKECGTKCIDKKALDRHMITHTNVKPYTCPHCPYDCIKKCTLIDHMKKLHGPASIPEDFYKPKRHFKKLNRYDVFNMTASKDAGSEEDKVTENKEEVEHSEGSALVIAEEPVQHLTTYQNVPTANAAYINVTPETFSTIDTQNQMFLVSAITVNNPEALNIQGGYNAY